MSPAYKILLLDDEQDLLELYRDILRQLPSKPDIQTASSGARAIAVLESEPFTMLISDLNMPKMDGLQVLSIVRRKFPHLRIVIMTSVLDEQYRSRAYAMGVDLFWEKPTNSAEIKLFQECVESLLGRGAAQGFRGVQSKSLVDIIQLECLSQSSSVLRILNNNKEGRIWVLNGELVDAVCGALNGEEAFKEICSWKTGNFEILPSEPDRPRTIHNSYQGLLLDSAQAMDEMQSSPSSESVARGTSTRLGALARVDGVEFLMEIPFDEKKKEETWGAENAESLVAWARQTTKSFKQLGEKMQAGNLTGIKGTGVQRNVGILLREESLLTVGIRRTVNTDHLDETLNAIRTQWAS
ncbi:MAG: Response regulator receiver protein [Verrucomicrobiales bacterium]|nr:Response regulator receiver protein [Verrucomicrobiales bacterium]